MTARHEHAHLLGASLAPFSEPIVVSPPLRVRLGAFPHVVQAGLIDMLRRHPARVSAVSDDLGRSAGVALVDPFALDLELFRAQGVPIVAVASTRTASDHALAAGAAFTAPLTVRSAELVDLLETASAGRTHVPPPVPGHDEPLLTTREAEVIGRICRGMSNAEIAADLFLGHNTVKTYVRTAYRKMGVTHRTQAMLWGLRRGVVDGG